MKRALILACLFLSSTVQFAQAKSEVSVLKPENCDIFYGKKECIYLNGAWKYKLVPGEDDYKMTDEGVKEKYFSENYDASKWKDIQVPKGIGERGYSIDGYRSRKGKDGPKGIGYYRKNFMLPEKYKGKRVVIYFQGIGWEPIVYVNGQEIARPKTLSGPVSTRTRLDITDRLKFGKDNSICVRIFQYFRHGRWASVGLYAPVWLEIEDPIYSAKTLITPKLPDSINVRADIVNSFKKEKEVNLKAVVSPWKNKAGTSGTEKEIGVFKLKPGMNKISFDVKINNPVLWDVFNPFLYSFKLKSKKYNIAWERFGLREIKAKGRYFYLNGKKIFLYGVAFTEGHVGRFYGNNRSNDLFWHNYNSFLRKYLTLLRQQNCFIIFRLDFSTPDAFSDICDEVGMLQVPSFEMLAETRLSNYAKKMVTKKGSDISGRWSTVPFDEDKKVRVDIIDPEGYKKFVKEAFTRNIEAAYNHPSIIAFAPEGETNRKPGITHMFPWYKKVLREIDPMRLFSSAQTFCRQGRKFNYEWAPLNPPPPYDFQNSAAVMVGGSSMNIVAYPLTKFTLKWCNWNWVNKYYSPPIPVVATESLFYGVIRLVYVEKLWKLHQKTYAPLIKNGEIDIEKYADLMSKSDIKKYGWEKLGWWPSRRVIKLAGIKNVFDKNKICKAVADRMKKYIELARIGDEYLQGFGSTTGPMLDYSPITGLKNLDPKSIKGASPIGAAFRKACAPVFICSPVYAAKHNIIAGDEFNADIYCFNGSFKDLDNLSVAVEIISPDGKKIKEDSFDIEPLKAGSKSLTSYSWQDTSKVVTGDHQFKISLRQNGKILSSNTYRLYLLNKEEYLRKAVESPMSAVIYAPRGTGQNVIIDQKLLDLGVKLEYLADFNRLKDYKRLIIGPFAVGEHNAKDLEKAAEWIKNGGKLLCFEQSYAGEIPWMKELSWKPLKVGFGVPTPRIGIDVEPLAQKNPVFEGISEKKYWETWNTPWGQLYKSIIVPLDKDALAAASALGRGEEPLPYGMVIAEKKLGKGKVLYSQLETNMGMNYRDAVANKYVRNLVKHFFEEK